MSRAGPYYDADAAAEMLREVEQSARDDRQVLVQAGRIGVSRLPEGDQHKRLGGEPRLDAGCRSDWLPAWVLMGYGGQPRWEREATYDELHRWCRKALDRQTDSIAEQRSRKAARPQAPITLDTLIGREPNEFPAAEAASYQAWLRELYTTPDGSSFGTACQKLKPSP